MITLKELKDKIEEIEAHIKACGFSSEEINLHTDYMNSIKDVELDFIRDGYYGIYVRLDIIKE